MCVRHMANLNNQNEQNEKPNSYLFHSHHFHFHFIHFSWVVFFSLLNEMKKLLIVFSSSLPFSFSTIHSFIRWNQGSKTEKNCEPFFCFWNLPLSNVKLNEWIERQLILSHQPKILYLSFSLQFWENFPKIFVILYDTMVVNWNSWVQLNFFHSFIQFYGRCFRFFLIFSNWFYPAGWGQRKDFLTLMFLNGFFFFFYHHHHHWCFWFDSFFLFCFYNSHLYLSYLSFCFSVRLNRTQKKYNIESSLFEWKQLKIMITIVLSVYLCWCIESNS